MNEKPNSTRYGNSRHLWPLHSHGQLVRVEILGEKMTLGDYWGPLGDETRSWLDHLATGRPCPHTTAEEARRTLEVTCAIELSVRTGKTVKLPLPQGVKD